MSKHLDEAEWKLDCLNSRMDALMRSDDDPCWEGYQQRGTKEKGGETVPNCVKADMEPLTRSDGFAEYVSKQVGTTKWGVNQVLTQGMKAKGHEKAIHPATYNKMMEEFKKTLKPGTPDYDFYVS